MTTLTKCWEIDRAAKVPDGLHRALHESGTSACPSSLDMPSLPFSILRRILDDLESELRSHFYGSERLEKYLAAKAENPGSGWSSEQWLHCMHGSIDPIDDYSINNTAKAWCLLLEWLHRRERAMLGK